MGILQTVKDLAKNARNRVMLYNPHSVVVIVSQKHITLTNSSPIIPETANGEYGGKLSCIYFYI